MQYRPVHFLIILLSALLLPVPGLTAEPADTLQKAVEYRDKGDLRSAVIELKNALQQNPNHAEARLLLGEIYLKLQQGAAAEKELRRAGELGAKPAAIPALLAEALFLQNKWQPLLDEIKPAAAMSTADQAKIYALQGYAWLGKQQREQAAQTFQKALAIQSGQVQALLGQAMLALLDHQPDQARELTKEALAGAPTDMRAWLLLGDVEHGQGHLDAAEEAYNKAIENSFNYPEPRLKRALVRIDRKDFAGAEEDIKAVKKLAPSYPQAYFAEGLSHFMQKRFPEAQTAFEQVLKTSPDNLQALFYRGAAHLMQGHLQQAEQDLNHVNQALPNAESPARLLARIRLQSGRYDDAATLVQPLLLRHPDDVELLELMARIKASQGDRPAATEYLEKITRLRPDAALPHAQLGVSLFSQGEQETALAELEKAVALDPGRHAVDITLIRGYLQAQKFDQALTAAQRLQEKWPDSAIPWVLNGLVHLGKKDPTQAREALQQALKLQPSMPLANALLANLALQEGKPEQARAYYQDTLKQYPNHPIILLQLAELELRQGKRDIAREYLQQAVTNQPQALEPRLALARLQLFEKQPLQALATLKELPEADQKRPMVQLVRADAQLWSGNAANAINDLKQLAEAQPKSVAVHYLLAQAYLATGNPDGLRQAIAKGLSLKLQQPLFAPLLAQLVARYPPQAETLLRELQTALPNDPLVLDLEGRLALKQGRLSQAYTVYRQARQRFPQDNRWVLALAEAQWQGNDRNSSIATLNDWLNTHPQDAAVQLALASWYVQLKQYDQARAVYTKVVELQPDNAVALNNAAWLLRKDAPQQALAYAERAAKLSDDANVLDTLATLLLTQNQTERALLLLQQAAKKQPDDLPIQYHLAMALAQNGNKDEAKRVLRQLLREQSEFEEREQAEALLAKLMVIPR